MKKLHDYDEYQLLLKKFYFAQTREQRFSWNAVSPLLRLVFLLKARRHKMMARLSTLFFNYVSGYYAYSSGLVVKDAVFLQTFN